MARVIDADILLREIDETIREAKENNDVAVLRIANFFRKVVDNQPDITSFHPVKCPVCNGSGNVPESLYERPGESCSFGSYFSLLNSSTVCRACNGAGTVGGNQFPL